MLLDQAAESFQKYAYTESIPNINSFRYRIVSGSNIHDRTIDILNSDDLLIVSKDSLGRNLGSLDKWLKGTDEIYLVVDEAHHSTAKTYRKIIDYVYMIGFDVLTLDYSPIKGPEGNIEYLVHIEKSDEAIKEESVDIHAVVEAAHGELDK